VTGGVGTFVRRPTVTDSEDTTRERERGRGARLAIAVVLALGIGFGVPVLWVWIGSKLQGTGSDSVNSSTAAIIFVGIIFSYIAILFIAGLVQSRGGAAEDRPPPRYPWNRSMRDEPYRPGAKKLSPIESAFVFTAVVVSAIFMLWFFVFAGSPLPNQ
jgi:multisubunit Na+/H+ antiporter MnhC subunit